MPQKQQGTDGLYNFPNFLEIKSYEVFRVDRL